MNQRKNWLSKPHNDLNARANTTLDKIELRCRGKEPQSAILIMQHVLLIYSYKVKIRILS